MSIVVSIASWIAALDNIRVLVSMPQRTTYHVTTTATTTTTAARRTTAQTLFMYFKCCLKRLLISCPSFTNFHSLDSIATLLLDISCRQIRFNVIWTLFLPLLSSTNLITLTTTLLHYNILV
jgi:hypothetical protein